MEQLPEELVQVILALLDERTLRQSAPRVCQMWARLCCTRGVWRNTVIAFEREADFAERAGWTPPAVAALELRRPGVPGSLGEEQWRTVLRCAAHARRLTGLCAPTPSTSTSSGARSAARQPRANRHRLAELLDKCWHSAEHVALRLEAPLDDDSARLWTLLASMPRLFHLELSMEYTTGPWLSDPEGRAEELCWAWDEGWPRLRRLDLRGVPTGPAQWLLSGFLRVRGTQLWDLILSPGMPLTQRFIRVLRQCLQLEHIGVACSKDVWRLDALPRVRALTLLGLPRRDTATWMIRSPLVARLESLSLDGVNPSLFDVLPAVGRACRNLRSISFHRCQVPARFALPLASCPLREVSADNMRAEHVVEAHRLKQLQSLRLSGHLGNYSSMMVAVSSLRAARPNLRVAGLEDGLFNNWGPGVQRALALARPYSLPAPSTPSPA